MSLRSSIRHGVNALERLVDRDPYHIAGYRGYGRDGRVLVLARVLQDEGLPLPEAGHGKTRNLIAMLKRLESDPLPFARVSALPEIRGEKQADEGGGGKADAPGVDRTPVATPTVVVDRNLGASDLE